MANMCVQASGYKAAEKIRFSAVSTAATIRQGVAIAQFALNAADAISNFRKLSNVTSRSIAIEEEQHNHLKDTFWPAERQMFLEHTQSRPMESVATLAKRYAGRLWAPIAAQAARELRKLECEKPRYCTNAHIKKVQELMVQHNATRANVTLLAKKIAYYENYAREETDWDRRQKVLAMRDGLVGEAASLMATAAKGIAGATSSALGAVNNAVELFGYAQAQRNNAENGVGRDPYFHNQVANALRTEDPYSSLQDPGGVSFNLTPAAPVSAPAPTAQAFPINMGGTGTLADASSATMTINGQLYSFDPSVP